jgi:hypothetical protein
LKYICNYIMSEAAPVVYMCKYIYANICNYNRRLGNSHRLQKSSKIVAKSKILGTGGQWRMHDAG